MCLCDEAALHSFSCARFPIHSTLIANNILVGLFFFGSLTFGTSKGAEQSWRGNFMHWTFFFFLFLLLQIGSSPRSTGPGMGSRSGRGHQHHHHHHQQPLPATAAGGGQQPQDLMMNSPQHQHHQRSAGRGGGGGRLPVGSKSPSASSQQSDPIYPLDAGMEPYSTLSGTWILFKS